MLLFKKKFMPAIRTGEKVQTIRLCTTTNGRGFMDKEARSRLKRR